MQTINIWPSHSREIRFYNFLFYSLHIFHLIVGKLKLWSLRNSAQLVKVRTNDSVPNFSTFHVCAPHDYLPQQLRNDQVFWWALIPLCIFVTQWKRRYNYAVHKNTVRRRGCERNWLPKNSIVNNNDQLWNVQCHTRKTQSQLSKIRPQHNNAQYVDACTTGQPWPPNHHSQSLARRAVTTSNHAATITRFAHQQEMYEAMRLITATADTQIRDTARFRSTRPCVATPVASHLPARHHDAISQLTPARLRGIYRNIYNIHLFFIKFGCIICTFFFFYILNEMNLSYIILNRYILKF